MKKKLLAGGMAAALLLSSIPVRPLPVRAAEQPVEISASETTVMEAEDYDSCTGNLKVMDVSYVSGGKHVGDFSADEGCSLSYEINVEKAGNYLVVLTVASQVLDCKAMLSSSRGHQSKEKQIPMTESWGSYKSKELSIWLEEGEQVLTVNNLSGTWNLDKLTISYLDNNENAGEEENYLESRHTYTIGADSIEGTLGTAKANPEGTSITSNQNGSWNTWNLNRDISGMPGFTAENMPMMEAVYNLSMEEAILSTEASGGRVFYTGVNWQKVWTRDTAMSVLYSLSWIFPEQTKNSIMEKVIGEGTADSPKIWEEDTGTGGSYPNSVDRIIMEIAGWELYKTTGDKEFLAQIYEVSKNTLEQDYHIAYDETTGLFKGETGGLDHRSKTYPDWMDESQVDSHVNIAESKGTNANIIFAGALDIMAESARILGKPESEIADWEKKYEDLKTAINEHLWLEDRGMYASWEYPEYMGSPLPDKVDVIANGYALMLNIADDARKESIMENYPLVTYGADTVWPQKNGMMATQIYHNRGIWPGWEASLMIGAKENGNNQLAEEIFKSCVRGAGVCLTNKEVIDFETGEGSWSDRQLWSLAGTLSGYYRVLFGMTYGQDGISFAPYVPEWMEGPYSLSNYKYRDAVLNLTVNGKGDTLTSITVNGEEKPLDYVFPADAEGTYDIVMNVTDSGKRSRIHLNEEDSWAVCPDLPVLTKEKDGTLTWEENPDYTYQLWTGKEYVDVSGGSYSPSRDVYGTYSLVAVDKNGIHSELSRPVIISPENSKVVYEAEDGEYNAQNFEASAQGYTGSGYVRDYLDFKTNLKLTVEAPQTGKYQISMIYNNYDPYAGEGQDCGIRSVYVDGKDAGTIVFPRVNKDFQRSTHLFVELEEGTHTIELLYNVDDWYDTNMTTSLGNRKNNICYDSLTLQYLGEEEEEAEKDTMSRVLLSILCDVYAETDTSIYTEESARALRDALERAQTVLEEGGTKEEIEQAVSDMLAAAAGLALDTSKLQEGIDAAQATANQAKEAAEAAQTAAAQAKTDAEAARQTADEAKAAAEAAQKELEAARQDSTTQASKLAELETAAKEAQEKAEKAERDAAAAQEAAEKAESDAEAAQTAADAAQKTADETKKQAATEVKKPMLSVIVDAYKDLNLTSYTETSASVLKEALTAAQEVLAKEDAAEEDIEAAASRILAAAAGLTLDTAASDAARKAETERLTAQAEEARKLAEEVKAALEKSQQTSGTQQPGTPKPAGQIVEGQTYDSGDYSYKVTSVEKQTAEVVGIKNTNLTKITVYNSVTLGGKSYKVTSVGASAFKGNKKAASAVIGKNVKVIGSSAFAGCKSLKKVTVKSTALTQMGGKTFLNCRNLKNITIRSKSLKKVGANALKGISKKAVIKVPSAKYKAYSKLLAKKGQSGTVKIKK